MLILAGAVTSCALLANYLRQVDVRRLMAIDGEAGPYLVSVVPVAAITAYALILVSRVVPHRIRGLAHATIAPAVTVMVLDVVVATELVPAALWVGPTRANHLWCRAEVEPLAR